MDKPLIDNGAEKMAAIATALHLYFSESVHDSESYKITIRRSASGWADKSFVLRKRPSK